MATFSIKASQLKGPDQLRVASGGGGGPTVPGLITWTTNVPASSQVEYGLTTGYGTLSTYDPARVTSHSVQLTGLTAGTTYHYRVRGRNVAGTESISADNTLGSGAVIVRGLITWTTDIAASSQVEYGPTTAYGTLSPYDPNRVTSHSVQLLGLIPGSTYHYCVHSRSVDGTETISGDNVFTQSTGYLANILGDSPVGYWRLDEPSGTVAVDTTGLGNPGTYTGSVTLGAPGALITDADRATTFNGSTGYVSIVDPAFTLAADLTLECWVKPTSRANYQMLITKDLNNGFANNTFELRLEQTTGIPNFLQFTSASLSVSAASAPPLNQWSHLAVVKSSTSVTHFLNGVANGTGTLSGSVTINVQPIRLAARDDAVPGHFLVGSLDEVAVYAKALSTPRVLAHYTAGAGTTPATLVGVSPTSVIAGSSPATLTFTGNATSWLTTAPTITASAGTLGARTAITNTSATATYTPRATAQTVTFTDTTDGSTTVTLTVTAPTAVLVSVSPTALVAGTGATTMTFAGNNTTWLTTAPTISASAGTISACTATTNTSATATYTPPLTAQTVTFTDTTDSSTTVTLTITGAPVLVSVSPGSVVAASGPATVTFTGSNTNWLTTAPRILTSAGAISTSTATSNTTATATFTPPSSAQTVTFTDTTDGSSTTTLTVTSTRALISIFPSTVTVGGGSVGVTFTGSLTTWLTTPPTITVSTGALGAISVVTNVSATATYTPPVTVQNVTFTDTTDNSTTVVFSITPLIVIPAQVPGMPPALVVEISFAANPNQPPIWVDVTKYVEGQLTIARGRQRELDRIQSGVMACLLDNRLRYFDPTATSSPFWPNVLPMRRIRVRATYANSSYPLYSGYIESWGQHWTGWQDATVPVNAADAFKPINLSQLNQSFPVETSDQRVSEVLSAIGWTTGGPAWILGTSVLGTSTILGPTGDRIVTPGSSTIQASVLANTSALQHLQDVTDTEMGLLFVDREGAVTFHGRAYTASSTSLGTFGESMTAGEMPYVNVELAYDDTNIWNDIEITRQGGTQQKASDLASQAQYYKRTLSNTNTLQDSDAAAQSLANALVVRYAQPTLQVIAMTLDGEANPAVIYPQMLGREIGDRVIVTRRPPGGGAPISQPSIIQGISITYDVTGGVWSVTWRLSPALTGGFWVLGDPVLSQLGVSTKLFF